MKYLITSILLALSSVGLADLPADPDKYAAWEKKSLENIQKLAADFSNESIDKLGILVMKLAMPYNREKAERPVFRSAQAALAGIPGHAKYYDTRIREAQAQYKKEILEDPLSPDTGIRLGEYRNEIMYGGMVMKNLPTPENVGVLGEMLLDTWTAQNVDPTLQGPTLAGFAVQAIHELPIRDKPTAHWKYISTGNIDEAIALWQKWYQQVKDGRRTFSFEGDPNVYSLTGPVGTAKNPDVPRAVKRPVTTGAEKTSPRSPSETHVPFLLWVAAIIAAISGGTYFAMVKSRAS